MELYSEIEMGVPQITQGFLSMRNRLPEMFGTSQPSKFCLTLFLGNYFSKFLLIRTFQFSSPLYAHKHEMHIYYAEVCLRGHERNFLQDMHCI